MPEWNILHCWGVLLSKGALRILFLSNERRYFKTNILSFCVCTFGVLHNVFPAPKLNDPEGECGNSLARSLQCYVEVVETSEAKTMIAKSLGA